MRNALATLDRCSRTIQLSRHLRSDLFILDGHISDINWFYSSFKQCFEHTTRRNNLARSEPVDQFVNLLLLLSDVRCRAGFNLLISF